MKFLLWLLILKHLHFLIHYVFHQLNLLLLHNFKRTFILNFFFSQLLFFQLLHDFFFRLVWVNDRFVILEIFILRLELRYFWHIICILIMLLVLRVLDILFSAIFSDSFLQILFILRHQIVNV